MEIRNVLNKYTADQSTIVWQKLLKVLLTTMETVKEPEKRYDMFNKMIYEIFDKACLEKKFVEMYAKLVFKATKEDSYKDRNISKEHGQLLK